MKVKVCGLTQPENIEQIASLGVDYIGLIFYEKSKRYAANTKLPGWLGENKDTLKHAKKVGVFVNAAVDTILTTVHDYELDCVQLHGDESAGYCSELQLLWSVNTLRKPDIFKAFSITPGFDFSQTTPYASSCSLFVFDTGGRNQVGGTGEQWDWKLLDNYTGDTPFLLSGGIGPGDAPAVAELKYPQLIGVDLNSKFETAPGVKDIASLSLFIQQLGLATS